jgi:hypothetical protein
MCGRVIQSSGPLRYAIVDGMNVRDSRVHNYPPRWNAAPSQELLVIRRNHQTGEVSLDPLRWGLIPYWCTDPSGGRKPINAEYETVQQRRRSGRLTASAWRAAFRPHAIILTEWTVPQPMFIAAFIGVERLLRIDFDLAQPPVSYASQAWPAFGGKTRNSGARSRRNFRLRSPGGRNCELHAGSRSPVRSRRQRARNSSARVPPGRRFQTLRGRLIPPETPSPIMRRGAPPEKPKPGGYHISFRRRGRHTFGDPANRMTLLASSATNAPAAVTD